MDELHLHFFLERHDNINDISFIAWQSTNIKPLYTYKEIVTYFVCTGLHCITIMLFVYYKYFPNSYLLLR